MAHTCVGFWRSRFDDADSIRLNWHGGRGSGSDSLDTAPGLFALYSAVRLRWRAIGIMLLRRCDGVGCIVNWWNISSSYQHGIIIRWGTVAGKHTRLFVGSFVVITFGRLEASNVFINNRDICLALQIGHLAGTILGKFTRRLALPPGSLPVPGLVCACTVAVARRSDA
jgi:hypothetical protein